MLTLAIIHFFAVVRVDLNQTMYETVEDAGSIEICASLFGPAIERNLMVLLITSVNTAQGK